MRFNTSRVIDDRFFLKIKIVHEKKFETLHMTKNIKILLYILLSAHLFVFLQKYLINRQRRI